MIKIVVPGEDGVTTDMQEQRGRVIEERTQVMERWEGLPSSVYFGGVIGSILLSAALYAMGKKDLGMFVGLWPPTILGMAIVAKQLRPPRDIDRSRSW